MNPENRADLIKTLKRIIAKDKEEFSGVDLTNLVNKKIDSFEIIFDDIASPEDREIIFRKVFAGASRTMEDGVGLDNNQVENFKPWYEDRKGNIESIYWQDYKTHLVVNEDWTDGLEDGTINSLDRSTDKILSNCADPEGPDIQRRGMVVGNVQAGKTANYLGVIAKAADAGYKVIIIVAGILEDLRKQTQIRLEEGFVGINDVNGEKVGVGIVSERDAKYKPICVTDRDHDLSKYKINSDLENITQTAPYVIVVKKNTRALGYLNKWLNKLRKDYENDKIPLPMLLIDDEADNASIDVRSRRRRAVEQNSNNATTNSQEPYPEELEQFNVSKINQLLRLVLKKFTKCTYIGYTATPFANIFISPLTFNEVLEEDLFPRNFIYYLEPASNYFGPNESFIEKKYDKFLQEIDIEETENGEGITLPHRKEFRLKALPNSLKKAIHNYIISTSIRWVDGDVNEHSSMLVNASCYSDVQISIAEKIDRYKRKVEESLIASAGLSDEIASKNSVFYRELKKLWEEEYSQDIVHMDWSKLKNVIHNVASKIVVAVVNKVPGVSERLNYEKYPNGRLVIAVGGYSLSRGLTLKGLICSYYLRTSRMYDTILQMGRWFGYRDGYENICRLFMTNNSMEDFEHITEVINDLNQQIRILFLNGQTPEEFALTVRSHPDVRRLMVTSRPKLGAAERVILTLSYAQRLVGDYLIPKDKKDIRNNIENGFNFINKLANQFKENRLMNDFNPGLSNTYAFKNIPFDEILKLAENHIVSPENVQIEKPSLISYMKERQHRELQKWDVIIDSQSYNGPLGIDLSGLNIRPVDRTLRIDSKFLKNKKSILTASGQGSTIRSNNIDSKNASIEEIAKARELINNYTGRLGIGRAISFITGRPLLIITIFKINVNPVLESKPEYTEYMDFLNYSSDLDHFVALSYRFPKTSIREIPREVYRNADIDMIREGYDDGDD